MSSRHGSAGSISSISSLKSLKSLSGKGGVSFSDGSKSTVKRGLSKVSLAEYDDEDSFAIDIGGITAEYIGTVPVNGSVGQVMCRDAIERMEKLTTPPKVVEIRVTTTHIYLIEKKKQDVMKKFEISDLTYISNPCTTVKVLALVEQALSIGASSCHGFRVAKADSAKELLRAVRLSVKVQQGKISHDGLAEIMSRHKGTTDALLEAVEKDWSARMANITRGEVLGSFPSCEYFGTLDVDPDRYANKDSQNAFCEQVVDRGVSHMITLTIYENCVELREDATGLTFQLFSIANIGFAKQVQNSVCFTVQSQTPGVWTCSVVQLVFSPAGLSVLDAINRARDGKLGKFQSATRGEDGPTYLAPLSTERESELNDVYLTISCDVKQSSTYLTPTAVGPGPAVSLVTAFSHSVKRSRRFVQCLYHGSIDILPPFVSPPITKNDVGREVTVDGYPGKGLLQFYGKAKSKNGKDATKCGVVFDQPVGLNNGTVNGKRYFVCKNKHGALVQPSKVHLLMPAGRFSTWNQATKDAISRLQTLDVTQSKVNVQATKTAFEIRNLKGNEIWHSSKPTLIPYFKIFGGGQFMAINVVDLADGQIYCRVLYASKEGVLSKIHAQIEEVQKEARAAGEHIPDFVNTQGHPEDGLYTYMAGAGAFYSQETAYSSSAKRSRCALTSTDIDDVDADEPGGVFEASFIGVDTIDSTKLRKKNRAEKMDVARASVDKVRKKASDMQVNDVVFMQINVEGIKLIAALGGETYTSCVMDDIRFTATVDDRTFVLMAKNHSTQVVEVYMFDCSPDRVNAISDSISKAVMAFSIRKNANPFAASGRRLAPPESLFKRQVHRADLQAEHAIGAGQFGQVYTAIQTKKSNVKGRPKAIKRAVKMLRNRATAGDRLEFIHESEMMLELDSEYLVRLVGVCIQQAPWLMVLEFLEYGDLRNVLKAAAGKGLKFTLPEQLRILLDVACGMEFMEKKRMVHMDLAARNCLVGGNNKCKVADFGLTISLELDKDHHIADIHQKLPIKWCSIEALEHRRFSVASDIWAYGITAWEVFEYGIMPYPNVPGAQVLRKLREGSRLRKPAECPNHVFNLLNTCWRAKTEARPSFSNVRKELLVHAQSAGKPPDRDLGRWVTEAEAVPKDTGKKGKQIASDPGADYRQAPTEATQEKAGPKEDPALSAQPKGADAQESGYEYSYQDQEENVAAPSDNQAGSTSASGVPVVSSPDAEEFEGFDADASVTAGTATDEAYLVPKQAGQDTEFPDNEVPPSPPPRQTSDDAEYAGFSDAEAETSGDQGMGSESVKDQGSEDIAGADGGDGGDTQLDGNQANPDLEEADDFASAVPVDEFEEHITEYKAYTETTIEHMADDGEEVSLLTSIDQKSHKQPAKFDLAAAFGDLDEDEEEA